MPFKSVKDEMDRFESGDLHSGSPTGPVVTNPKQAIAIALSEKKKRGEAVPGQMATRQALRGIRNDSIRHIPAAQRRGNK